MKKIKKFLKENWKPLLGDLIFFIVLIFIVFYKFPYIIYTPGGTINVSDRVSIDGLDYKEKGSYNLSYVTTIRGNVPNMVVALLKKTWEIVPIEDVTYEGYNYDETYKIEKYQYDTAIETAAIVAYEKAGKEIEFNGVHMLVYRLEDKSTSTLELLDEITKIEDNPITEAEEIRKYVQTLNVGDTVTFTVIRDGNEITATAKVYASGDNKLLGVNVLEKPDFKIDPSVNVASKEGEVGASGGFMTALAIYDKLLEEDLTKGKIIVGTGTIDLNGNVGEIGGIKYKMLGASKDDVDIFFVPKENYKEALKVKKEYKLDFEVVKVEKFDDAINYLNGIK